MATLDDIPEEDRSALKAALEIWVAEGVANPQIPLGMDIDGDGVGDSVRLNDAGELEVVSGVLDDTVFFRGDGVDQDIDPGVS